MRLRDRLALGSGKISGWPVHKEKILFLPRSLLRVFAALCEARPGKRNFHPCDPWNPRVKSVSGRSKLRSILTADCADFADSNRSRSVLTQSSAELRRRKIKLPRKTRKTRKGRRIEVGLFFCVVCVFRGSIRSVLTTDHSDGHRCQDGRNHSLTLAATRACWCSRLREQEIGADARSTSSGSRARPRESSGLHFGYAPIRMLTKRIERTGPADSGR